MTNCLLGVTTTRQIDEADTAVLHVAGVRAIKTSVGYPVYADNLSLVLYSIGVTPAPPIQYCDFALDYISTAYSMGGRLFEIQPHPNLHKMGFGDTWTNGHDFAAWWIEVREALAEEFPGCQWGFPSLRAGGRGAGYVDSETFLFEANLAIDLADFICEQAFWKDCNTRDDYHPHVWRIGYRVLTLRKPVYVEFSNTSAIVKKEVKARQYLDFWREMERYNGRVVAAFCGTLSSANRSDKWITWRGELNDAPNSIPLIIGSRST